MNDAQMPLLTMNACTSCKHGKRKCDRVRPSCSTCTRVGRACIYEDLSAQVSNIAGFHHAQAPMTRSEGEVKARPMPLSDAPSSGLFFASLLPEVDPFRHDSLRQPTVDVAVSAHATKILGALDKIPAIAATYFNTIYHRLPIISRKRFYACLPSLSVAPRADFTALCLCLYLVQQYPSQQGQSMQSSLYVNIKSIISLLESTGYLSLDVVQSRAIVSFYEMGHGIYPAASISIAACAMAARSLGLHKRKSEPVENENMRMKAEEERRVWWAVINMDRFINLCNGDALFSTEDPQIGDLLPVEDTMWSRDMLPNTTHLNLATPSDITVGQLARECQISHLVGRVLRHVLEPTPDPEFHAREALQLERTLMAFMPLLEEEQLKFGLYCAALGMCSWLSFRISMASQYHNLIVTSALFTLYDAALLHGSTNEDATLRILRSLDSTSLRIAQFSGDLFGVVENIEYGTLSPYIPYSLYQAAVIQFRLWKQGEAGHEQPLNSLKKILALFSKRWLVAGKYSEALENFNVDWPSTMLSH